MDVLELVGGEVVEGEEPPALAGLAEGELPVLRQLDQVEEHPRPRHPHLAEVGQHLDVLGGDGGLPPLLHLQALQQDKVPWVGG